ncbi:MAG: hypothetical protein AB7N70_15200 [Dehalococcoidia bacterium]
MRFLNRLFGGKKATPASLLDPASLKSDEDALHTTLDGVECPHTDLGPYRANEVDVVGQMKEIPGYQCRGCGRVFSPAEAVALREQQSGNRPSQTE